MDYPSNLVVPTHINTLSRFMVGRQLRATTSNSVPASQTWTANAAIYIPLWLPWPFHARRAFWSVGGSGGGGSNNSDIGIYSPSGTKLWSSGSTNNPTSSVVQYATISGGILLTPGMYFIAHSRSDTNGATWGNSDAADAGRVAGLYQQSSALPLPATATFAAFAGIPVPLIGLCSVASGF